VTETALASRATELRRAFDQSFAVPADDNRFTNKKLADRDYARGLLEEALA